MEAITIRLTGLNIERPDPDKSYCVAFTTDTEGLHLAHNLKFEDVDGDQSFYGPNYFIPIRRVVWWILQEKANEFIIQGIGESKNRFR